ncbi:MAG: hypothetical protein GXP08_05525 [Gammaproteobacteria bacterium]|nr:hypothetical protein [Gammaproteobacteria bacterium]
MGDNHKQFAIKLAEELFVDTHGKVRLPACHDGLDSTVQVNRGKYELVNLNLTPFMANPQAPTAAHYFANISTVDGLIHAYHQAKHDFVFEDTLHDAMKHVSGYASDFLQAILVKANDTITDQQAGLIADWLVNLDVYAAVKSTESLLNSRADLSLLEISRQKNWNVHFDHLAIRCGTRASLDAERIVTLLKEHHGYRSPQMSGEAFYQFPEGWNAYPLYKQLSNGQVLRIFVDQSDASHPAQIIQHWNSVYGYTAHHLAMRATQLQSGQRLSVALEDIIAAITKHGVDVLQPTGEYTEGLLQQVFTKPEKNMAIPISLKHTIGQHGVELNKMIENGKLLEIVSRREMPTMLAQELFALYGLRFEPGNGLHSAPYYQYFLPAQAAHVIKTSLQTH